ncbi:NUDIX hydrolase [Pseudogemmobacter sp. W21_MBD1_M6]|uniref:NUDIX hydrolase n=1 Tax=Pseudogemmobacter sp. W21_MBD1_M6 TaxID=3240271 RepID=UPI003F9E52B9
MNQMPQRPIPLKPAQKSSVRTQFAALCYRIVNGKTQILLITSRASKRWIIPKGWPIGGMTPAQTAEREAYEEAGVTGRADNICVGLYCYSKCLEDAAAVPVIAAVFPVKVKTILDRFPEQGERRRKWFSVKKAAKKVQEPELAAIIARFEPSSLRR